MTPILRHKSSSRSALILFKCFNALSVKVIAGARPPVVGGASTEADALMDKKRFLRLTKRDDEDLGKEIDAVEA